MAHLIRAGLVLAAVVILFLVFRSLVLQGRVSLPEFGLRPVMQGSNIGDWASKPFQFSTPKDCAGSACHQEIYDMWATSAHGGASCETCHGPVQAHVQDPETPVQIRLQPEVCELCHAEVVGRPEGFPQINPAEHYPESTCTSCHIAHRPGPATAVSHQVWEGSDCLSCHAASAPPDRAVPADHAGRTNEQCLACHETAQ